MELLVETTKREEIIDITDSIRTLVEKKFNENSKACLVYTEHTTCAVLIQENYDSDVKSDILKFLSEHVPREGWGHLEGNSDAHIKSMLVGPSKIIPVKNKKLLLGKWQGISLCEFDGPRTRRVRISQI